MRDAPRLSQDSVASLLLSDRVLTIIAALTETTRVIGVQGRLPWHLPEDLQRFKALTVGHPIIMGRKTWEFGLGKRMLPHRHNIVVSRSLMLGSGSGDWVADRQDGDLTERKADVDTSLQVVRSLPEALMVAQKWIVARPVSEVDTSPTHQIFVMGGASVYAQTLAFAHRLELTLVHDDIVGDAFFPAYTPFLNEFDCVAHQHRPHTIPPSTYVTYQRRL